MSKYHEAANTLRREAQRYEALSLAAKALDEVGSLDQAASEAEGRVNAAEAQERQMQAAIVELNTKGEELAQQHEAKRREAEDIFAETVFNANEKARAIIADAEAKAVKLLDDAELAVQTELTATTETVTRMREERAALDAEIEAATQRLVSAEAEAVAAEKRLAKVKESIAKLASA